MHKKDFIQSVGNTPLIYLDSLSKVTGCEIYGKAEFMNPGGSVKDEDVIAAANRLATEGISARVVNMATISPLDEAAIIAAAETGAIVTVEEHNIRGGLGGELCGAYYAYVSRRR